jgi:hypothetical protein
MDAQRKPPAILFVLIFFGLAPLAPARATSTVQAEVELIDGGADARGRLAGVRLRLPGESLTYWRDPGDAGVAPSFDFSHSDNLVAADVLFPAPARLDEAGAEEFGYRHEVTFPLRVTARDPSRPIRLVVGVDYALCEKLCIPGHADLRLDLPPQGEAAPGFSKLLARVPRVLAAGEIEAFATVSRIGDSGGPPQWLVRLTRPADDLFVEAPAGFHFSSRRAGDGFVIVLDQGADNALPNAPLRVTVAGEAPVEFFLSLK